MNTNQLAVIIQAILDEKGVVNDIPRIQKVLKKHTLNLTAEMDKKALIKSVQSVLPSVINELRNIPGVQIPVDVNFTDENLIANACTQVEQANKRMRAEFEKTAAMSKQLSNTLSNDKNEKVLPDYENAEDSAFEEAINTAISWKESLTQIADKWTGFTKSLGCQKVLKIA